MPKYRVAVRRHVTEDATVEVEAADQAEAEELALEKAQELEEKAWDPEYDDTEVLDVEKI